ncbi:MAG: hypothetical protein JWO62_891 [Acidimicrobiaceae bacterium]|nr:hypothetical protein [Acidimicrobiaceae bacterium]
MRFSSWRVDGYGVLAEHRVDDLPDGLSIVHGPNEAGKSTLLDFIRGVLFGFPDRRHRRPMHEPLRGGRHGGAIGLVDAEGCPWLLERYAGTRSPTLSAPDGSLAGDGELRRLLGGADAEVFRSVFAFGLGELASLDTLERDEVRELVFSAGVLGAGRSATKAVRSLVERQGAIVRPRQQDALANRLRKRLDELDGERRSLRTEASEYPSRARSSELLAGEAGVARDATEQIRMRVADMERIESGWPVWLRRTGALASLARLPELDAWSSTLLEQEGSVSLLARERSGHDERVRRHANLLAELDGIEREISVALGELGHGLDIGDVLGAEAGIEIRARVDELAEREPELKVLARTASEDRARAGVVLADCTKQCNAAPPTAPGGPAPAAILEAAARDLHELRQLVEMRDRLAAERATAEQTERLARLAAPRSHLALTQARALGVILLVLACALAGAAAFSSAGRSPAFPLLLAGVAAILLALAVVMFRSATHRSETTDPAQASSGAMGAQGPLVELERLSGRIGELADGLGLAVAPSAAEVTAALSRNEADQAERRRLDGLERAVEVAAERVDDAEQRLLMQREAMAEVREEVAAITRSLGLKGELSALSLVKVLSRFDKLRELDESRTRLEASTRPLAEDIAGYEEQVASVAAELDEHDTTRLIEADGARGHDVVATVDLLERRLAELLAREASRSGYEQAVADADSELARMLGGAKDADRLRAELELGDVVAWQAERAALERELAESAARFETLLRDERDAQRALEELESSARLAEIELEISEAEAELASAMEQYAVLGIARSLLEQTLRRYERERQPAVVARAGMLFDTVTEGRYVQLVARADGDGGRSHGIWAMSSSGERIDSGELSRGTAEQLYLCLRLALATSFAGGSVALPLVLDDVLVNFDPARAAAVARAVAEVAETHQVLAFTCHPHVVELLAGAAPSARVVELPPSR